MAVPKIVYGSRTDTRITDAAHTKRSKIFQTQCFQAYPNIGGRYIFISFLLLRSAEQVHTFMT